MSTTQQYKQKSRPGPEDRRRRRHHLHRRHLGRGVRAGRLHQAARGGGRRAGAAQWDGWAQMPAAVQGSSQFNGKRYGVPTGTDGRVLFFNKQLFARAGLPADWQPKSWQDVARRGRQAQERCRASTRSSSTVAPRWARRPRCRACCRCSRVPGAGLQNGKWQGDTQAVRGVLGVYKSDLRRRARRSASCSRTRRAATSRSREFAADKIGILLESDYFWRSVVEPKAGVDPDADPRPGRRLRDDPGPGARRGHPKGQDFVSMSGGSGG